MYFCKELIYLSPVTTINISFGFFFCVCEENTRMGVFKKKWKKCILYLFLLTLKNIIDIPHVW